jgi:hypothetical protein
MFEGEPYVEMEAFCQCPIRNVKVAAGMRLDYSFPADLDIEFFCAEE